MYNFNIKLGPFYVGADEINLNGIEDNPKSRVVNIDTENKNFNYIVSDLKSDRLSEYCVLDFSSFIYYHSVSSPRFEYMHFDRFDLPFAIFWAHLERYQITSIQDIQRHLKSIYVYPEHETVFNENKEIWSIEKKNEFKDKLSSLYTDLVNVRANIRIKYFKCDEKSTSSDQDNSQSKCSDEEDRIEQYGTLFLHDNKFILAFRRIKGCISHRIEFEMKNGEETEEVKLNLFVVPVSIKEPDESRLAKYCLDFGSDAIQIYSGHNQMLLNISNLMGKLHEDVLERHKIVQMSNLIDNSETNFYENKIFKDKGLKGGDKSSPPHLNKVINFYTDRTILESYKDLLPNLKLQDPNAAYTGNEHNYSQEELKRCYITAIIHLIWCMIKDNEDTNIDYYEITILFPNIYTQELIDLKLYDIRKALTKIPDTKIRGFELKYMSESDAALLAIEKTISPNLEKNSEVLKRGNHVNEKSYNVCVIDCGKGTTDITIAQVRKTSIKEGKSHKKNILTFCKFGNTSAGNLLTYGLVYDILLMFRELHEVRTYMRYIIEKPYSSEVNEFLGCVELLKRNMSKGHTENGGTEYKYLSKKELKEELGKATKELSFFTNFKKMFKDDISNYSMSPASKNYNLMCETIADNVISLFKGNKIIEEIDISRIYLSGRSFYDKRLTKVMLEKLIIYFESKDLGIYKIKKPKQTVVDIYNALGRMKTMEYDINQKIPILNSLFTI